MNMVNILYILKIKWNNPFYILLTLKTELIYRAWRDEMNEPLFYVVIKVLDIHDLVLSQSIDCHRIFNNSNMRGATSRAGITTPFGETVFIFGFCVFFILSNYMFYLFLFRFVISAIILASKWFDSSLHPFVLYEVHVLYVISIDVLY